MTAAPAEKFGPIEAGCNIGSGNEKTSTDRGTIQESDNDNGTVPIVLSISSAPMLKAILTKR